MQASDQSGPSAQAGQAASRSEQALAVSLAQLRATLEAATDGVLVVDHHDNILHYNRSFLRLWGLTDEAMANGKLEHVRPHVYSFFSNPKVLRAKVDDIYAALLPETFDVLELMDGRVFERYSRTQVVDGSVVGRVWSFRDVTLQRRAQAALKEEARLLETLNRLGIALNSRLDVQAVVQTVTDAATELTGAKFGAFFYTVHDGSGGTFQLFALSGAPREAFEKLGHPRPTGLFQPTFMGEGPIRIANVREDPRYGRFGPHHGQPPGHLPVVSYLAMPVISRSGEVIGGLLFGHPEPNVFTERAERLVIGIAAQAAVAMDNARLYEMAQRSSAERAALLEAERAARSNAERMSEVKDQFLATLSHELRTPLSAILGWAQVLKRNATNAASDPQQLLKGLETIERNARVQTQLIDDLLDMSRIASGKLRLDIQTVVPITFIEAAIQSQMPAAQAKGIRIERMLDPLAGPISGDPSRLQQVMWNLLSNAIKFTPKDGKVQVTLERVNSHIEINVADTGIGIEAEFLPHVFERFQQADASTTRKYGGLGLGLSIVKNLVELHGGAVKVRSGGKEQGTTFSVQLPLTVAQRGETERRTHPAAAAETGVFSTVDLAGLQVLVVDDEPDARELVRHILAECGAQVRVAEGPREAIALINALAPDVLVSDIGMPEMDGFEMLRRVRAQLEPDGRRIAAVALTAFARSEDRIRALQAGFLMHLAKPVEPSELIATVASVAGRNG
jgi:PAS domain S-box-containing protein